MKPTNSLSANPYLNKMYKVFTKSPEQLSPEWRSYFEKVHGNISKMMEENKKQEQKDKGQPEKLMKVYKLVSNFRNFGHYTADLDPLKNPKVKQYFIKQTELQKIEDIFSKEELQSTVHLPTGYFSPSSNKNEWKIAELIEKLNQFYCSNIAFEFSNVPNEEQQQWIIRKIESDDFLRKSPQQRRNICLKLHESQAFHEFFQENFSQKLNYGIEGMETFISGLANNLEFATELGVNSFDIAMSHRGRLNTLACVA